MKRAERAEMEAMRAELTALRAEVAAMRAEQQALRWPSAPVVVPFVQPSIPQPNLGPWGPSWTITCTGGES